MSQGGGRTEPKGKCQNPRPNSPSSGTTGRAMDAFLPELLAGGDVLVSIVLSAFFLALPIVLLEFCTLTVGSWRKYFVHNFFPFFVIWQLLVAKCMNLWRGLVVLLLWRCSTGKIKRRCCWIHWFAIGLVVAMVSCTLASCTLWMVTLFCMQHVGLRSDLQRV